LLDFFLDYKLTWVFIDPTYIQRFSADKGKKILPNILMDGERNIWFHIRFHNLPFA
jgi:hypothetical protein